MDSVEEDAEAEVVVAIVVIAMIVEVAVDAATMVKTTTSQGEVTKSAPTAEVVLKPQPSSLPLPETRSLT